MKVDFSTIALILLVVLPGYCAFKVRNLLSPRSFAAKGPTEELASFVALSVFTHMLLAWVAAGSLVLSGLVWAHNLHYFFARIDQADLAAWFQSHRFSGSLLVSGYFLLSCITGAAVGSCHALGRQSLLGKLWRVVVGRPEFR